MKVKILRAVMWPDNKSGRLLTLKVAEVVEVDERKQNEDVYGILMNGQAVCIDPAFIPLEAKYLCLHSLFDQGQDGTPRNFSPGKTYTLDQEQACRLMVQGYVKPVEEKQWRPVHLLTGSVNPAAPRRMFDEPVPDESWAMRDLRRQG